MKAVNRYVSKSDVDQLIGYRMDEVEAMFFIAQSWHKVKPETIQKCWGHTNVLAYWNSPGVETEVQLPSESLPLEEYVVEKLDDILSENFLAMKWYSPEDD